MLPSASWKEGDDGQGDRAAPLQPPELAWNKLAPQSRCPPMLGQDTPACFDYIFYMVLDSSPLSNNADCQ